MWSEVFRNLKNMIFVKEHIHSERRLLSICDGNLIGKTFEENKFTLKVSEIFYHGEPLLEKDILNLIEENTMLNIIGEESIKFALKNNFIEKTGIKKIENIPFALSL